MHELSALFPYFIKYRQRFLGGVIFIILSNYFAVLSPQLTGFVIDLVQQRSAGHSSGVRTYTDPLLGLVTDWILARSLSLVGIIALCGITLLVLALLRGLFMFFMRQTLIVMSRHIEYDQKNEIYSHYQQLEPEFYKTHQTGDMMNRVAEDVSRVRMFTGPAVMYLINLLVLISLTVYFMVRKNPQLSLVVMLPLPVLAITIYFVNNIIHKKSEQVQSQLSGLTTDAQQSFSGIRVIKSFVQESAMISLFSRHSEAYRRSATDLYKTEALYFPSMALIIGISTLLVIYAGGNAYMRGEILFGDMAAFIMYLTMLMFPVSAIGWVASTIQRASASQKRINEFLHTKPAFVSGIGVKQAMKGEVVFENVSLRYPHSGTLALKDVSLNIRAGEKIAVVGRTGSGKSSLVQLLLRFYDPSGGEIRSDGVSLKELDLIHYRQQIGYVPQDSFLFSDTIANNLRFGVPDASDEQLREITKVAAILNEVESFEKGFDTVIGERGVTLSGGQKQRLAMARAMLSHPQMIVMDDCLNAVDYKTERAILTSLDSYLKGKTAVIITNRIFSLIAFDRIIVLENGQIAESGTHEELLLRNGVYRSMYDRQSLQES